jgi:hypothetical protein
MSSRLLLYCEPPLLLVMSLSRTLHLVPSGYSSVAEPIFIAEEIFRDALLTAANAW